MKKTKLDQFHWHEALDRATLFANIFDAELATHPVMKQTKKLRAVVSEISDRLHDLYHAIEPPDVD
jgi:hypothetical protein